MRNNLLYSNRRMTVAVILADAGCLGLIRAAYSSGTMTDGTNKIGDWFELNHAQPTSMLARPAGMDAHDGDKSWGFRA